MFWRDEVLLLPPILDLVAAGCQGRMTCYLTGIDGATGILRQVLFDIHMLSYDCPMAWRIWPIPVKSYDRICKKNLGGW
jgi:hypothetical protein